MKIKVTQEKLSKALNNVSRIAIGKVTLPILLIVDMSSADFYEVMDIKFVLFCFFCFQNDI